MISTKGTKTKIKVDNDLRYAGMIKSYDTLHESIKKMFGKRCDNGYKLIYKNKDNDEFVLESEYEFNVIRSEVENSLLLTIKFNSNSNIKESNNSEIEKKTKETQTEELKTPSI